MSDLLAAALLEKYISLLRIAVDQVEPLMPTEGRYWKKNLAGEDVEIVPGLKPIYSVIGMMRKDVECLRRNDEN